MFDVIYLISNISIRPIFSLLLTYLCPCFLCFPMLDAVASITHCRCAAAAIFCLERMRQERYENSELASSYLPTARSMLNISTPTQIEVEATRLADEAMKSDLGYTGFYPIGWRSDPLVLLSRCILLLQNLSPVHMKGDPITTPDGAWDGSSDILREIRAIRACELIAACINLDTIEIDSFAGTSLSNYALSGSFHPSDLPHPDQFLDLLFRVVIDDRFDCADRDAPPRSLDSGRMICVRHLGVLMALPQWATHIRQLREEVEGRYGVELTNSMFDLARTVADGSYGGGEQTIASYKEIQQRCVPMENRQQHLNSCARCDKFDAKSKCGKCKKVAYCSKECQVKYLFSYFMFDRLCYIRQL
jgi:hypothetical protein